MRLRRLSGAGRRNIALTNSEFNLLAAFLAAPQRVLSRDQLLGLSRLHNDEVYDRSIDVQVGRLRKKIQREKSGRADPHRARRRLRLHRDRRNSPLKAARRRSPPKRRSGSRRRGFSRLSGIRAGIAKLAAQPHDDVRRERGIARSSPARFAESYRGNQPDT